MSAAPIVFRLQFTGASVPMPESPNLLRAALEAASVRMTTEIGPAGIDARLERLAGQTARLSSVATLIGEREFIENGTITYGKGGTSLSFTTHQTGCIHHGPDGRLLIGAIIWRITAGTGQFAGATGYITANFFYDPQSGQVTDNQTIAVYLPE